jgi:hypothetical protein
MRSGGFWGSIDALGRSDLHGAVTECVTGLDLVRSNCRWTRSIIVRVASTSSVRCAGVASTSTMISPVFYE